MAFLKDEGPGTGEELLDDAARSVDHDAVNDADADVFREWAWQRWQARRHTGVMRSRVHTFERW